MFFNKRAIVGIADNGSIKLGMKVANSAMIAAMIAAKSGILPEEVTTEMFLAAAEDLALYSDEYDRRHDTLTGHDAGQCSGKL